MCSRSLSHKTGLWFLYFSPTLLPCGIKVLVQQQMGMPHPPLHAFSPKDRTRAEKHNNAYTPPPESIHPLGSQSWESLTSNTNLGWARYSHYIRNTC